MPLSAEVVNKLFSADLQKILFPNNEFMAHSINDKAFHGNDSIDVPQETIVVETGKNPSSYPLEVQSGYNAKRSYGADLYYSKPFHIPDREEEVLSYNKRQSILEQKAARLNTDFANDCAYAWAPTLASSIIRTTGANNTGHLLPGATGTRKEMTLNDFIEADRILTNMEVPEKDRVALLSANMYAELLQAGLPGFIGSDKLSADLIKEGVVGMILGFKIFKRSSTVRFDNAGTPAKIAPGTAAAITDNDVAVFWHKDFVRKGKSAPKVYAEMGKPAYLGSIANCSITAGADIARNDEAGVVALVQAA